MTPADPSRADPTRTDPTPAETGDGSAGPACRGGAGRRGGLVVVSGPGGVGKGTVVDRLRQRRPDIVVSVSATTRPPRPDEVDGVHYHFLSDEEFTARVARDEFLEWAEFNGRRYGTLRAPVEAARAGGAVVLLEIEVQGARQVRQREPDAHLVFVAPPSGEVLAERLRDRGDAPEQVRRRLAIAQWELEQAREFHHVVVNDDLETCVDELAGILDRVGASG